MLTQRHSLDVLVLASPITPSSSVSESSRIEKRGNVISYIFGSSSASKKKDQEKEQVSISEKQKPVAIIESDDATTDARPATISVGVPVSRPRKKRNDDDDYYIPGSVERDSFFPYSPIEDKRIFRGSPGGRYEY